jgi:hypothetical protein
MGADRAPPPIDPRIETARRVVRALAWGVLAVFCVTAVLGAYHCATERPARELFFDRAPDTAE